MASLARNAAVAAIAVGAAFTAAKPAKAETNTISATTIVCATHVSDAGATTTDCVGKTDTITAVTAPPKKIPLEIKRVFSDYPETAQRPTVYPCGCEGQSLRPGQGNGG